ncbi:MAG: PTS sugar transporter subunit IIA [Deltaproteobacteria bacterium]|nr:PTS sugar transporter subunit IIA [Deltaproteobacteria bacterium]
MKILDILKEELIIAELKASAKKEAIEEMSRIAVKHDERLQFDTLMDVLLEREKLGSTGIGDGVAIPHGKVGNIDEVIAVFARSSEGVDFDSMDGKKTHLFFLLIAPENSTGAHLKALARISRLMKEPNFRMGLMEAKSREELYRAFADEDSKY